MMRHQALALLVVMLLGGVTLSPSALAQTSGVLTVSRTDDLNDILPGDGQCLAEGGGCTLRAAIQEANARTGVDTIQIPEGTYALTRAGRNEDSALTGDLDVSEGLTIVGAGQALTVIDGGQIDRVLQTAQDIALTLRDLSIQGGSVENPSDPVSLDTRGGAISSFGPLTLERVSVCRSSASFGGGIWASAMVQLIDSSVCENRAQIIGGGMWVGRERTYPGMPRAFVDISGSIVADNSASYGGGIALVGIDGRLHSASVVRGNQGFAGGGIYHAVSSMTIDRSAIIQNSASTNGGGIFAEGRLLINASLVSGNQAAAYGGAIRMNGPSFELIDTELSDNRASYGGAISGGATRIERSRLIRNTARQGGALHGSAPIIESVLSENRADEGGAIWSWGPMTLDRVLLSGNSATTGGALWMSTMWELTAQNSAFVGNSAEDGGAIYTAGRFIAVNTTISGNRASRYGGGIRSVDIGDSLVDLSSVTLSGNSAGINGAGVYLKQTLRIRNTILAANMLTSGVISNCAIANGIPVQLYSEGYNLVGNVRGCEVLGQTDSMIVSDSPALSALTSNSLPVLVPLQGSPALDAGDPQGCRDGTGVLISEDQRGVERPVDGDGDGIARCDIGAAEANDLLSFPMTSIRDTFNQQLPELGSAWLGNRKLSRFTVQYDQLSSISGGSLYWNQTQDNNQEVYVRLTTLPSSGRVGVLCRVQGVTPHWSQGAIRTTYDPGRQQVSVSAYLPDVGWRFLGRSAATFAPGDQLGARCVGSSIQVYQNGRQLLDVAAPPLRGLGGAIGLWVAQYTEACFDDFGGGRIP